MYNRQSRVNSYRVFDLIAALDQLGEVIWNAMCTGKAWPLRGVGGGGLLQIRQATTRLPVYRSCKKYLEPVVVHRTST